MNVTEVYEKMIYAFGDWFLKGMPIKQNLSIVITVQLNHDESNTKLITLDVPFCMNYFRDSILTTKH